jgi:hypothetical protein
MFGYLPEPEDELIGWTGGWSWSEDGDRERRIYWQAQVERSQRSRNEEVRAIMEREWAKTMQELTDYARRLRYR